MAEFAPPDAQEKGMGPPPFVIMAPIFLLD
jgi:hypothetical protein